MTDRSLVTELAEVVSSVLGVDAASISETTAIDDVESWDSLSHLALVLEIEHRFNVRFTTEQIPQLTSVRAIIKVLEEDPTADLKGHTSHQQE